MESFLQLNIQDPNQILSEYVNSLRPDLQADVERALPTDLKHSQNLAEAAEHSSRLSSGSEVAKLTQMFQKLETKIDEKSKLASVNAVEQTSDPNCCGPTNRYPPSHRGHSNRGSLPSGFLQRGGRRQFQPSHQHRGANFYQTYDLVPQAHPSAKDATADMRMESISKTWLYLPEVDLTALGAPHVHQTGTLVSVVVVVVVVTGGVLLTLCPKELSPCQGDGP